MGGLPSTGLSIHEASKGSVFPNDRDFSDRAADQPSVDRDASIGARIARARRDAGLTQRALADLVGVRLWVVDRWESGSRSVSGEQLAQVATATNRTLRWLETGVGERAFEQIAPERTGADVKIEESHPERDERLADVAWREGEVGQKEHEVDQTLAETDEQPALPESVRGELAEIETARREVTERLAELGEREAALALQKQELQLALLAQADEQRQYHEGLADAPPEDALARTELDVRQALTHADELRSELERERAKRAEIEEAHRQVESSLAEVAERERRVAEREARFEARALGLGGEVSEFKALAQWLTDSVREAAKREAEAMLEAAREQARQILANAKAEREPPGERIRQDEPVQEPETPPAL
jgi:transcriptional regulator with XRE-family HTH domain